MKLIGLATLLLAMLAAPGCPGASTTVIPTRDLPQAAETPTAQEAPKIAAPPDSLDVLGGQSELPENQFVAADKAGDCPMVDVTTPQGKKEKLQLGKAGYLSLVVVWTMDSFSGPAAFRHVGDLARKYAGVGVRAVGIVEMTPSAAGAGQFADQQGIAVPIYFDDKGQSALRELTGTIGAKEARAVPSIFIVDRRLKLRFCRPGFRFAKVTKVLPGTDRKVFEIIESVPADQTIDHFLNEVLKETNW